MTICLKRIEFFMHSYLDRIRHSFRSGVATELTYCQHLGGLIQRELSHQQNNLDGLVIEAQPSQNNRFPDFVVFDDQNRTVVRIEAKLPTESLEEIVANHGEQLTRYLDPAIGHPNLIITNFLSFSYVRLEGDGPALFGEVFDLISHDQLAQPLDLQMDIRGAARDRFRELLGTIGDLQPVPVNSASRVRTSLSHLSNAVVDWYQEEPPEGQNPIHERVIRNNLRELSRDSIGPHDPNSSVNTFGQLIVVGYCMNEFIRQRSSINFENWEFSPEIFSNPALSTILTLVHSHRKMIGIETLDYQVRYGLSQHLGEISPEDNVLEQNMRTFESFLHDYLALEDEDWVSNFGLVPTPPEIVRYMVHKAEQEWVAIEPENRQHGLLSSQCSVLDPCTGSGHFYIEVLRRIHELALARNLGPEWARDEVRRAIGTPEHPGRIHAFDIQPMCIIITEMQLRLFCEDLGWNSTAGLMPQIFIQDGLELFDGPQHNLVMYDATRPRRMLATHPASPISITLGNVPWGSHSIASSFENNTVLQNRFTQWTRPFFDWYTTNINSHGKSVNREIAYGFFFRYLTSPLHELIVFVAPDTIISSSGWMGFRRWASEHHCYIRMDNLGGSSGLIQRPDGEPLFLTGGVPRTTSGATVYTMRVQEGPPATILARDCWDEPEGERWTTDQKLAAISAEAFELNDVDEYAQDYSIYQAPPSKWRPMGEVADAPLLPQISRFDRNYSGMEANNGGMRMVNGNGEYLLEVVREVFGYEQLALANNNPEFMTYTRHVVGGEEQIQARYSWLHERVDQFEDFLREVSMSPMCNLYAFAPTNPDDNGKCQLKLWKAPRVHENILAEDHQDQAPAQGYLSAIQRITSNTQGGLGPGFVVSHNLYHPGQKDTAYTNGRSFPRSVFDGENWIPNISDMFQEFLSSVIPDIGENPAESIWDYVLCILSSEQILNYSNHPVECYDLPILITNDQQVWRRVVETGTALRILQECGEILPENNPFRDLHNHVSALVGNTMRRNFSEQYPEDLVAGIESFIVRDLKNPTTYAAANWRPSTNQNSPYIGQEGLDVIHTSIQEICEQWELNMHLDYVHQIFAESSSIVLDHQNNVWLCGIPRIVTQFKLAGHLVLKKWLAYNSDLSSQEQYLHSNWGEDSDEFRTLKWEELCCIIRNITTMSLLSPIIDRLFEQVNQTSQSWLDFLSNMEEE